MVRRNLGSMQKLHILSELFYPNKTSTAYIMTELANYLAGFYEVSVITTDIKYDENVIHSTEDLRYKVTRKSIGNVNKNSFLSRIKGAVGSSFLLAFELLKNIKNKEKVFVVTNPFLIILFVAIIRNIKNFEFTLLVHDVFPENSIPAGLNNKNSIIYRLTKFVFDWSYRKADKVIVLGDDMKELLMKKGVQDSTITVIPNWYDDDLVFTEFDREKYLAIPNLENKIVIGFAGNVGRVQGLDYFIDFFKKADNSDLVFVVVGDGAMLSQLKENNLNRNIYFLGSKPRNEQSQFLHSFDISLVTLAEGMYGLGVPSKSYNILKSGKPIFYIGDSQSEIDLMINKFNCGWSFDWSNEEKIITLLKGLKLSDLKEYGLKNKKLAQTMFNSSLIKEQFLNVLNK